MRYLTENIQVRHKVRKHNSVPRCLVKTSCPQRRFWSEFKRHSDVDFICGIGLLINTKPVYGQREGGRRVKGGPPGYKLQAGNNERTTKVIRLGFVYEQNDFWPLFVTSPTNGPNPEFYSQIAQLVFKLSQAFLYSDIEFDFALVVCYYSSGFIISVIVQVLDYYFRCRYMIKR